MVLTEIPANKQVPGVFVQLSAAPDPAALTPWPVAGLIIAQRLDSGTATAMTPIRITSGSPLATLAGKGSQAYAMIKAWLAANPWTELWWLPIADDGGWTAAARLLTVVGPATANGTLYGYIAGTRITVPVTNGQTAAQIRDALVAAINAEAECLLSATVASGDTFTVTSKNKGLTGNGLQVKWNHLAGESFPAGVQVNANPTAGGAGEPNLNSALLAVAAKTFQFIAAPYTSSGAIGVLKAELNSRFLATRRQDGQVFLSTNDSLATIAALASETANNRHVRLIGSLNSPTAHFVWAAQTAAVAALRFPQDPAAPVRGAVLPSVIPPLPTQLWTHAEREQLLLDGVSTWKVSPSGEVVLERLVTTEVTDANGNESSAWHDCTTWNTAAYLRHDAVAYLEAKFQGYKQAEDGNSFGALQKILTPSGVEAELVSRFKAWMDAGLVEDLATFKANLHAEIPSTDKTAMHVTMVVPLVNPHMVLAIDFQFQL